MDWYMKYEFIKQLWLGNKVVYLYIIDGQRLITCLIDNISTSGSLIDKSDNH